MIISGSTEYMLPLEEEVGKDPSVERMQKVVAEQKKRPPLTMCPTDQVEWLKIYRCLSY